MKKLLAIALCILVIVGLIVAWKNAKPHTSRSLTLQKAPTEKTETVKEIGLTMTIPYAYSFAKENQMNYTTHQPYGATFTIQNFSHTFDEVKDPYQLYGFVQWDTEKVSVAEFTKADFAIVPTTRKTFTVDGLPAVSGMAQGKRPRYLVFILLKNGYLLKLAASGLATDYKQHTDTIVRSMKFK